MKKKNYDELSSRIIELVGNRDNILNVAHCFTRLRFDIKNKNLVQLDEIKKLKEVAGTQWVGDQLQIIIGQEVADVYESVCKIGNLSSTEMINENLDRDQEKLSIKTIFNKMIATITTCVTPVFIIFTLGGLLRLSVVLLGSQMFGILPDDSEILVLLSTVGDTCFRFFPIYIAYIAAQKFGANVPMALILACLVFHPTLLGIVESGKSFHVFGIPMIATDYAGSFLPSLLITWVLSKVESFFKDLFPNVIKGLLYPLCTILVMLPIALCVLGPIGSILGSAIMTFIVWLKDVFGPLATALVGAFFPFLIVTGMHHALNSAALVEYTKNGFDTCVWAGSYIMDYQLMALPFASLIKSKKPENKALALNCIATEGLGGISEPTIFGFLLKGKRNMAYAIAGGFASGFYIGLMNVNCYVMAPNGFMSIFAYSGSDMSNMVNGVIACAIAFFVPFVLALIFGLDE